MCRSGYITASEDTPSKSGLYFTDLSGCTISLLEDLVKEDQADSDACFDYLLKKAWTNLQIDVHRKIAGFFHIDKKLITRETSKFEAEVNASSGLAGVRIQVNMPKYARLQILSIGVYAEDAVNSPAAEFKVFQDDENGDLLSTISSELTVGRNTIDVYEEFEEISLNGQCILFVAYDPQVLSLRKSINKYYSINAALTKVMCSFPCFWSDDPGLVVQINEGGLNVKFVVYCSIEKFICENLPLFGNALLYRLGVDTMKERITSQLTNLTTVLTEDRAKELMGVFNEDYQAALNAATSNLRMSEDPICFSCKRSVSAQTNLP